MRFIETTVAGVWVVEIEALRDERGFFSRTWCEEEAARHGAPLQTVQCNVSFNAKRGTLRGMHFQKPPFEEIKLVRCTAGGVIDIAIDIRPGSPTYGRHVSVELTASNHRALYIPIGCAHGFLTLSDDTEVAYQMSQYYSPGHGHGIRWNDPYFAIAWPEPVVVISDRDRTYPDFVHPIPGGQP